MEDNKELLKHLVASIAPHIIAEERKLYAYEHFGNLTCERCGSNNARKNRQRTQYVDDESNWAVLCPECQEESDEYWGEMWNDYYRSVL